MKKLAIFVMFVLILGSLGCNLPATGGTTPAGSTPPTATVGALPPTNTPVPPTPVPPTPTSTPTTEPTPTTPLSIAYLESGDAYLWRDGGLVTRLTATGDVCRVMIAPDASVVLFSRGADCFNSDLWAIQADGSGMRMLFNDTSFDALVPGQQNYLNAVEFIPGTTSIAFNTGYTWEGPGQPRNMDLNVLDYNSGTNTVLLPPGTATGAFNYSPDGQWVALVDGDKIDLMAADGSGRRTLFTYPFVYTYSEWAYYPEVVWNMDSSSFRVAVPFQDPLGDPTGLSRTYEARTDGSVMELGQYLGVPVFISFPGIIPNGQFFAYVKETAPSSGVYELHIATLDMSSDNNVMTGANLDFAGWSPDSNAYLFWSNSMENLNLGSLGSAPFPYSITNDLRKVKWVDPNRFTAEFGLGSSPALRLYSQDGSFVNISVEASSYDYAPRP